MVQGLSEKTVVSLVLAVSVALGPVVRLLNSPQQRRWLSTLLGFFLLYVLCEHHFIWIIIIVMGNCFLVKVVSPSKTEWNLGKKSFLWNFGCLAVYRSPLMTPFFPFYDVANIALLILTLKMVGLAFEIEDSFRLDQDVKDHDDMEIDLQRRYCTVRAGPGEVVSYAFCHIGLLSGPYYKYRTYHDWLCLPKDVHLNVKDALVEKLKPVPLIVACHFAFDYLFPLEYVGTEAFMDSSFWYRCSYMVPMFIIFRTKMYFAWILGDIMCMTAGLGAYPVASKPKFGHGPTDYKQLDAFFQKTTDVPTGYNFETIRNFDIYGIEFGFSFKHSLRSWHLTVQYWMAIFVTKRLSGFLKPYRMVITMAVSAFWHGVSPGFYLCFFTGALMLVAEDAMVKAFRPGASSKMQKVFDWTHWFLKGRFCEYIAMAFLLLELSPSIAFWRSIYFIGHIVVLAFLVLGIAFKPPVKRPAMD